MNVPDDVKYMESHEWVKQVAEGEATVGISDHAQEELSDVVYLELPEVGKIVAKGDRVAVVESVKAASDIYAPLSGEIIEVNKALADTPELMNSDPFGAGWIFTMKFTDAAELETLMDAEAYRKHTA